MDNMDYMMKLARRSNLKADHLREDIVKEATSIIKLRVAQGFAFCDLKDNYDQLENNHERLHHNMLEVQMQQEDISGQLQEELRLRPQTINKVKYTRSLCETLEQCCSRLQQTLTRCQDDQAVLYRVYNASEKTLHDLQQSQERKDQEYKRTLNTLNNQLKLLNEGKSKIEKELDNEKQQSNDTKCALICKAEMIMQLKEQMSQIIDRMSDTIDKQNKEISQRDEHINKMKQEVKQQIYECETQCMKMKNDNIQLDNELKVCAEAKAALQVSLKESIEKSNSLIDNVKEKEKALALLQTEKFELQRQQSLLSDALLECQTNGNNNQEEIRNLNEKLKNMNFNNEELMKQLQNFDSTVKNMAKNNEDLKVNNEKLSKELFASNEDVKVKINTINEISSLNDELTTKITQLQENGKVSDEKLNELRTTIDTKQRDLHQLEANINIMMKQVKDITDAKSRVEAVLEKKTNTYDQKISQYEDDLNDKNKKLENNFRIILDIRAEKTRLLEKISSLETTIGNIHKQVATQRKVLHEAEHDSPRVSTQQRGRRSSNKDNTKSDQRRQPSAERDSSQIDKLPVLQICSNEEDESQTWTTNYQPIKRRRQQEVVAQTQPPPNTYNPYSTMNLETEMTTSNERVEKPRFFKTKKSLTRGKNN